VYEAFRRWLNRLKYDDSVQQQQARTLQLFLLCTIVATSFGLLIPFFAPIGMAAALAIAASITLVIGMCIVALWLLRRNQFYKSVFWTVIGITVFLSIMMLGTGLNSSGATLAGFCVPLTIGALLAGRRVLWITFAVSMAGVLLTMVLEYVAPQLIGFTRPQGRNEAGIVGGYLIVVGLLCVILSRFSTTLYRAITDGRARQQELEGLKVGLENTISERTATLQEALDELASRAAAQEHLLATTQAQRAVIQQLGVPIIPLGASRLLVPLVGELDAERMNLIADRVIRAAVDSAARLLVLDITGVPFVDAATVAELSVVINALRLVGAQAALVGINPEVAQSLVASGLDVASLPVFATLEQALGGTLRPALAGANNARA
jgi:rsbT co-antagonist protein RsbR